MILTVDTGLIVTIIVIALIAVACFFAIRSIVKNKGKCSCGCSSCPYSGSCHKKDNKK